jgi:hypothetical protein
MQMMHGQVLPGLQPACCCKHTSCGPHSVAPALARGHVTWGRARSGRRGVCCTAGGSSEQGHNWRRTTHQLAACWINRHMINHALAGHHLGTMDFAAPFVRLHHLH